MAANTPSSSGNGPTLGPSSLSADELMASSMTLTTYPLPPALRLLHVDLSKHLLGTLFVRGEYGQCAEVPFMYLPADLEIV